jgi:hypothetical protein
VRELAEYRTVAERRDFGETARHLLRRRMSRAVGRLTGIRMSRPGARCRHCCWSVSPGRSPNPPCVSPRNGLSMVPAVGLRPTVNLGLHLRYPPLRTHRHRVDEVVLGREVTVR